MDSYNDISKIESFDSLKRFIFNEYDLRGEIVQLNNSFSEMIKDHNYPKCIQQLLGELQVSICLITEITKFSGSIMLQIRGGLGSKLHYAIVNSNHRQETRGVASYDGEFDDNTPFLDIVGKNACMTLTIIPDEGSQYQGIIDVSKPTLSECIEEYFIQSMQINTKIWLYSSVENKLVAGIMIQNLPTNDQNKQLEDMNHVSVLTDSLTDAEIFSLDSQDVIYRLFNQESVNVFPNTKILFKCVCSKEHFKTMLTHLNPDELASILNQDGKITCECHCCGKSYTFYEDDIIEII